MANAAGFAIVIHEFNDVRRGKAFTKPRWTPAEDTVLYNCVHRRLSNGIGLDGDAIFDEIIQHHPTWQRSVLAIKTRVVNHATTIRTQMMLVANADSQKARRESDNALQNLERSYMLALDAAAEANAILKKENDEFFKELESAKLELTEERENICRLGESLSKAKDEIFDAGRVVQDLAAENLKLNARSTKMAMLARLMADPATVDKISVDALTFAASNLSLTNFDETPAGEKGDDVPPLPQVKPQAPQPFFQVKGADEA